MKRSNAPEAGYALVAAVACLALFGLMALAMLAWTQRSLVEGGAEVKAAKVAVAADAGVVMALHGLLARDATQRWPIDGRQRQLAFGDVRLIIRIVDERGKVPLNLLEEDTATALFEAAGLSGEKLRIARDSLLDWIDDDDEPRPDGAEASYYRRFGISPRNGAIQTIEELGRIRGLDAATVARLRPIVTADFGSGSFDLRYAQPIAIAIMSGKGEATPETIQRAREAAGQVTALGFVPDEDLKARPLTIEVLASRPDGARAVRRCIVEITGNRARPYAVRSCT